MPYNMNDELAKAEAEWGASGQSTGNNDWFKFKEGDNKIRILSVMPPVAEHFKAGYCVGHGNCPECKKMIKDKDGVEKENKPSVKYLCYILDHSDNKIKLAKFAYKIFTAIRDLQSNPDYVFDDMPMPYGINIKATKAGTTSVEYNVIPSRANTPIPTDIIEKLAKLRTPEEIKVSMRNKKAKELGLIVINDKQKVGNTDIDYPEEEINPDDIPF